VRFTLTAGQKGDAPQAAALIEGLPAEVVMADTAYDADHVRQAIAAKRAKRMFVWTVTQGLVLSPTATDDRTREPRAALDAVMESKDPAIFLLKDFHAFISDTD